MSAETTSPTTSTGEHSHTTVKVAWDHLKQRYVSVGWRDENQTQLMEALASVDPASTRSDRS